MTDMEKTLKGLEIHGDRSDKTDCDDCPYSKDGFYKGDCIGQLCRDALALLKEQEAKPVKVSENAYGYKNYYCPNCGKWFDYKDVERKYCHRCGQEVKWDD